VTDLRVPGSRAVVIGASSYLFSELANVPAVLDTVSDLRTALIERCGLARDAIRFMPDWPDAASVGSALAREAERTEGVLLVYYAGHGLVSQRGELYLAMGETNPAPGQLEHTALSYDMVRHHLQYSPARASERVTSTRRSPGTCWLCWRMGTRPARGCSPRSPSTGTLTGS
jgi:hypothetical protein